jgi:hypothetical protein
MKSKVAIQTSNLRLVIALFVVLTEILFISTLASAGIELILSSVAVTVALLIQLRFGIRRDSASPADIVVFIFNWLFLDLAPKVQLMDMPQRLVNTSTVSVETLALTNLVCALFMIAFTLFYEFYSRRIAMPVAAVAPMQIPKQSFTGAAVALAVVLCILVVGIAAPGAYREVGTSEAASPASLILNRFLLFLPSATLLILLNETVRSGRKVQFSRVCALLVLLLLVFITENPYTEKRNALGPVYLAMLLVAFQNWFAVQARRMMLLVGGMVVVFPGITIFTHNHSQKLSDLTLSQFTDQIAEHYFSINYDSWANIYSSVEIVRVHGVQWGHQLLGAVLFFVPSAIWTSKPLATGIFIADYLIANYSMWFTNLSAPIVAEGYLDFGALGVIGYAAAIAFAVTFLNKLAIRQGKWLWFPLAVYGSVFLMLVMRGSLMIAFGFAGAAFLAFCFAAGLLSLKLGVRHQLAKRPSAQPTMAA